MIYLGADHRGYQLKEKIKQRLEEWARLAEDGEARRGYEYQDLGNTKYDPGDDYPIFAIRVAKKISNFSRKAGSRSAGQFPISNSKQHAFGILVCGTGIGMDIVANKFPGVRCGLGFCVEQIKRGREEDDINCLALAADFLDEEVAKEIIKTFLETPFSGQEDKIRRIEKIE